MLNKKREFWVAMISISFKKALAEAPTSKAFILLSLLLTSKLKLPFN